MARRNRRMASSTKQHLGQARRFHRALVRDLSYRGRRRLEELHPVGEGEAGLLQTALDPVVTMDHRGRILDLNPGAERAFGYPRAEAVGHLVSELFVPPAVDDPEPARVDLREDGVAPDPGNDGSGCPGSSPDFTSRRVA